jgi:hypothetical protein
MTLTERIPTMVATCGCPYDPEYDEGVFGLAPGREPPGALRLQADADATRDDPPAHRRRVPTHGARYVVLGTFRVRTNRRLPRLGDYVIEYTQAGDDDEGIRSGSSCCTSCVTSSALETTFTCSPASACTSRSS